MEYLNSLKKRSKHFTSPFEHWEMNEPLTKESIKEICDTEIADIGKMNINYDGTRAIDGGEGKFRGRAFRGELTRKDARILWNRARAVEQTDECREPVPHRTCVWSKFSVHSQCNLLGQGCKIRHIHSSTEHPLVRL